MRCSTLKSFALSRTSDLRSGISTRGRPPGTKSRTSKRSISGQSISGHFRRRIYSPSPGREGVILGEIICIVSQMSDT